MASAMDDETDNKSEEIEAEDCREKDSSNDEEMYAESSNSSLLNNDCCFEVNNSRCISASSDDAEGDDASSFLTDILPQSQQNSPPDENSLLNMSTEEQIFYENFKDGNQDLLNSLKCTTCSNQLFLVNHESIRFHPVLGVLVCKPCREFYSTGPFTKDSNGQDEYCRWCAQGGTVICCDHCSNVFCKSCLRRYLGRATLMEINTGTSPWGCLVCNISPIWAQRALSRMVLCDIQQRIAKPIPLETVDTESDDPAVWLPAIISEAENIASYCKSLTTKVGNRWLKNSAVGTMNGQDYIEKAKVAEICRKLRNAANVTRMNMKKLDKAIVSRYSHSYGNAVDLDSRFKHSISPRRDTRVILKIKNYRKETDHEEGYYAEIRASPLRSEKMEGNEIRKEDHVEITLKDDSSNDNHVELTNSKPSEDLSNSTILYPNSEPIEETSQPELPSVHIVDDEEIQQQTIDSNDKGVEVNVEDSNQPQTVAIKAHSSATKKSETVSGSPNSISTIVESIPIKASATIVEKPIPSTRKSSKLNLKKLDVSPIDANKKAKDQLLISSSDSDDSIGDFLLSPRAKKTPKRNRPAFLGLDDPKLKAECAVVIERINNPDDVLAVKNEKNLGTDKLGQKINRLINSPLYSVKKPIADVLSAFDSSGDEKVVEPSEKPELSKKNVTPVNLNEDSNSKMGMVFANESNSETASVRDALDTFPSLRSPPKKTTSCNPNELARQQLLCSASSESEGEDGEIEVAQEPLPRPVKNVVEKATALKTSPKLASDVEMNIVTDEDTSSKEANFKSSKLLRMSLGDPLATKESSKTSKEKAEKKAIKKKRRIDSESEGATSDSDFEAKKKKTKRPTSSAHESNSDTEADSKPKSKRRRRIKKTASSEEESSDSDIQVLNESQRSEANGSKGRKNIKKIIKDQNLKDETKKAAKEEEERKKRIADRQKQYNDVFVGDLTLSNAQIDHLVLDFDPKTKEELVSVDQHLVKKLKPHQVKGVKFMWDASFESIERMKEHPGSGCILAHCMGLGKSLQVVTLVHTVLTSPNCKVDRVLVVCPLSTVLNWVNEFSIWLPGDLELEVYELTSAKTTDARTYTLNHWFENGGVLIIGYEMYRNLTNENSKNKKISKKARDLHNRALVDPGPDLVICDEGHLLKNESSAISKAMSRIRTKRRIVLTGTPLQNSLIEYHCMIQFVKPNLLGNKKEFTNRFANPIKNGQAADSTDADVRIMKRRAHVLHKMLEDSVQRFDYSVLTPFLPPKHEYVVSVKMSDLQIQLYQHYLEYHAKGGPGNIGRGKGAGLFADFQELGRIWTHPRAMQMSQIRRETKLLNQSDSEGSLKDFIVDSDENDDGVVCLDESGDEDKDSDNDEALGQRIAWKTRTRAGRGDQPPPQDELGVTAPSSGSWWSQFVKDEDMVKIEHSGKLVLLMDILRQCELIGDKVLVFSQSLFSLELIEEFLAEENLRNEANRATLKSGLGEKKVDPVGSWIVNCDYFRLDGQSSADNRKNWCNAFNNPNNLRSRLFLISTKAGGLGINLVAANRVVIFDASWNPSHDVQSIFRVFRFGQKKPCYIYRFLAQGTMEEKIYDRQVTKLSLSCRVVDEQQIERHFNSADLNELYVFEPDSHLRRPTPLLPKDRLLAELTIQRKEWIVTYHEHDSLLENKAEEELTELERKAAWDDFENEKRGISNNVFMQETPGLATFLPFGDIMSGLAGRSVAGIPLSNIAAMIYNSNPGITQDEFLGRLRLTVDQLQNFSVQQAAAANQAAVAAASAQQNQLQQPAHTQQLLMQRQVAQENVMKRQSNNASSPLGAGPSGLGAAAATSAPPRSRGRPTIGPHQRTDLYGLPSSIYNSNTTHPAGPSGFSAADKNI